MAETLGNLAGKPTGRDMAADRWQSEADAVADVTTPERSEEEQDYYDAADRAVDLLHADEDLTEEEK